MIAWWAWPVLGLAIAVPLFLIAETVLMWAKPEWGPMPWEARNTAVEHSSAGEEGQ